MTIEGWIAYSPRKNGTFKSCRITNLFLNEKDSSRIGKTRIIPL